MALDLDSGSSQYVTWTTPYSLSTASGFSCSFWLNPSSVASQQRPLELKTSGGAVAFNINLNASGALQAAVQRSTTPLYRTTNTGVISASTYAQVQITYDGSGVSTGLHIYVDGSEPSYSGSSNGGGTHPTADGDYILGYRSGSSDLYYDGLFADLAIWSNEQAVYGNLAYGYHPTEYDYGLRFYCPLSSDLDDDIEGVAGSITNEPASYGSDPTYQTISSGLTTDLKAAWLLNETSGNRADSFGSNTLVDNNSVSSATGSSGNTTAMVPQVASFASGSSQYLSIANNADIDAGNVSWCIAFWLYLDSPSAGMAIITKAETVGNAEWDIFYTFATNIITGRVRDTGGTVLATAARPITTGVFNFVVIWHDADANTVNTQVNGGIVTSSRYTNTPADNNQALWFGRHYSLGYLNGRIGPAYFWKRVLSGQDRQDLWNYGQGYNYPFTTTMLRSFGEIIATDALGSNGANTLINMGYSRLVTRVSGGNTYDAICYFNNDSPTHAVIQTRLNGGSWTKYVYDGVIKSPEIVQNEDDGHNAVSMGIDPNGYLHIVYDVHADPLTYRKSSSTISSWTGNLTAELSMLGLNESSATYPCFFNDPSGILYFMFRDGIAGDANIMFYVYDEDTTTWSAAPGTSTNGLLIQGKVDNWNAYICHPPVFDSDFGSGGKMHMTWTHNDYGSNADVQQLGYVRWNGSTFEQSDGSSQTTPITLDNDDILIDFTPAVDKADWRPAIYSDSSGNPHIVYKQTDGSGYIQLHHIYHNGSVWSSPVVITENATYTERSATGTLADPNLLIDRSTDRLYVFYAGLDEGVGLFVRYSDDLSTWSKYTVTQASLGRNLQPAYWPNWEANKVISAPFFPFDCTERVGNPGVDRVGLFYEYDIVAATSDININMAYDNTAYWKQGVRILNP